jgi:hypothetical protein
MKKNEPMSRRRALKILGIAAGTTGAVSIYENPVLGQHKHMEHAAVKHAEAKSSPPRFFNAAEMATISVASGMIIPADEKSGGAVEAGVPAFIDLMVSTSPPEVRTLWRDGLKALDAESREESGKSFVEASASERMKQLEKLAKNEMSPKSQAERLFRAMKLLTIDGYYTSEIGIHKDLEYKGNSYTKDFVGCTHPEHKG